MQLLGNKAEYTECLGQFKQIYGLSCSHSHKSVLNINLSQIHLQLLLSVPQATVKESDLVMLLLSPMKVIAAHIQRLITDLDVAQLPTFLFQLESITQNPVPDLTNPYVITTRRGRPVEA